MRELTHEELISSAKQCIGMSIVFIGNDEMPANYGKITGINEGSESFLIHLNNDGTYEIPFSNVMFHTMEDFKEWVLESIYDRISKDYGLPPVAEMILADLTKRKEKKQEKIKMAEEKRAAKVAKEEAKKAKQAAKQNADAYQLVVCKKDAATKKAEYSRVGAKSDKIVISVIKELLTDSSVTSIQIVVKK